MAGVLRVFEYDVEALDRAVHQEPARAERGRRRPRRARGLGDGDAGDQQGCAAVVQREVQAAGRQEHRIERGHGRRAARARSVRPAGRDCALARSATRPRSSPRSAARASRGSTSSSTPTPATLYFNEINTLPGSLAFYLWSAAPHYWTITELVSSTSCSHAPRRHAIRADESVGLPAPIQPAELADCCPDHRLCSICPDPSSVPSASAAGRCRTSPCRQRP